MEKTNSLFLVASARLSGSGYGVRSGSGVRGSGSVSSPERGCPSSSLSSSGDMWGGNRGNGYAVE